MVIILHSIDAHRTRFSSGVFAVAFSPDDSSAQMRAKSVRVGGRGGASLPPRSDASSPMRWLPRRF